MLRPESTTNRLLWRYNYIYFMKIGDKPKTSVWTCRNNRSDVELGQVRWNAAWRQYCYFTTVDGVYSTGCLADIREFINRLQADRIRDRD